MKKNSYDYTWSTFLMTLELMRQECIKLRTRLKNALQKLRGLRKSRKELQKRLKEMTEHYIASEVARKKTEKLAMIHSISGLYNLNFINAEIERIGAIKRRDFDNYPDGMKPVIEFVCMIFIDIDNLKTINDKYGHDVGNMAFKKLGQTLKSIIRREDRAAWLHGDEFVIISLTNNRHDGKKLKARTTEATRHIILEEQNIEFSASVGYQCVVLRSDFCFQEILNKADFKMYKAKNGRKRK